MSNQILTLMGLVLFNHSDTFLTQFLSEECHEHSVENNCKKLFQTKC